MAVKKYYWLKLKDDFFRQKEIKKLRKIAGGDTYTVIYLKMLLLAMKNDNKLFFDGVEDEFAEELALELDEDEDNVKMTLAFLQRQKLIEMVSEDEYLLPQCQSMTGIESTSAERVRKHRLKQKEEQKALQCNTDVTDSNKNVTTEIEKEKEIEKELELDKDKDIDNKSVNPLKEFKKLYEQNIGLINGISAEWIIEISEIVEVKVFKKAIQIATDRGACNLGYVRGILNNWINVNALTIDAVEAYELQKKSQKGVVSNDRESKNVITTESSANDPASEEARRAELLRQIRELDN